MQHPDSPERHAHRSMSELLSGGRFAEGCMGLVMTFGGVWGLMAGAGGGNLLLGVAGVALLVVALVFATATTLVRLQLGADMHAGIRSRSADLAEVTERLRSERMMLEAAREVEATGAALRAL